MLASWKAGRLHACPGVLCCCEGGGGRAMAGAFVQQIAAGPCKAMLGGLAARGAPVT